MGAQRVRFPGTANAALTIALALSACSLLFPGASIDHAWAPSLVSKLRGWSVIAAIIGLSWLCARRVVPPVGIDEPVNQPAYELGQILVAVSNVAWLITLAAAYDDDSWPIMLLTMPAGVIFGFIGMLKLEQSKRTGSGRESADQANRLRTPTRGETAACLAVTLTAVAIFFVFSTPDYAEIECRQRCLSTGNTHYVYTLPMTFSAVFFKTCRCVSQSPHLR